MRRKYKLAVAVVAAALLLALGTSAAQAQFNAPILYNEGPGVKLSDSLVFHPGVAIEGRYDSNVFYSDLSPRGAPYLRIIPHFDLATRPPQRRTDGDGQVVPQKVDFRAHSAFSYREYFHERETVRDQRAFEVELGLALGLNPQGVFSFEIVDDYARSVTARNAEGPETFTRNTNRLILRGKLAPGGGRLGVELGYGFNFDIFEDSDLAFLNKLFHDIQLTAKWKILPKTAALLEVLQQVHDYYDETGGRGLYVNNDSYPFRVSAGLIGLITTRLSTIIKVGYGNGFYTEGPSFNSVIAKVEAKYSFGPFARFRLGYEHNFMDSLFANFATYDAVYLGYEHFIASRLILRVGGDYRYRRFDGLPAQSGATALRDHVVTLLAGLDFQIKEWLYVGAGYDLQLRDVAEGPRDIQSYFTNSYTKHQVFGKVGVSY